MAEHKRDFVFQRIEALEEKLAGQLEDVYRRLELSAQTLTETQRNADRLAELVETLEQTLTETQNNADEDRRKRVARCDGLSYQLAAHHRHLAAHEARLGKKADAAGPLQGMKYGGLDGPLVEARDPETTPAPEIHWVTFKEMKPDERQMIVVDLGRQQGAPLGFVIQRYFKASPCAPTHRWAPLLRAGEG